MTCRRAQIKNNIREGTDDAKKLDRSVINHTYAENFVHRLMIPTLTPAQNLVKNYFILIIFTVVQKCLVLNKIVVTITIAYTAAQP